MQAIAVVPGTTTVRLVDRPEPFVTAPDDIKLKIIRVGICGTDREETSGGRALLPPNQTDLVIGHEMFGQTVQVGSAVTRVKPGDYAVFTVRRGCGHCLPCNMNRSDMCRTGDYRERGIWGLDGYQTEFVVDKEQYVVHVPAELEPVGVLLEPLSIATKAITESTRVQITRTPDSPAHLDWLHDRPCLVAGLGPIGLLAAMVLRLNGAEVWGLDIVDANTSRPQWLTAIGGHYIDGRKVPANRVKQTLRPMELIFEATGIPRLEFNLLDALALNGIYVLTGIPGGNRPLQIDGACLIRSLVLDNQLMLGSVNGARNHFQMAASHLFYAHLQWPTLLPKLITTRHPYHDFLAAFQHHDPDEIKTVIEWAKS